MYIVIVGAGEVGTHLAELLSVDNHDVVVIDNNTEKIRALNSRLDVMALEGDAILPSVLREAKSEKADLVLCVTDSDEVNIVASSMARQMGAKESVLRIHNVELRTEYVDWVMKCSSANAVIDPDASIADAVVRLLRYRGAVEVNELAQGNLLLLGARVDPKSALYGQTLSKLASQNAKDWDYLFVGLTRNGHTTIPRGDTSLQADDQVRVLCTRRAAPKVTELLGLSTASPRHIILLGGGDISMLVAERIQYQVRRLFIIEKDLERAQFLEANLPGATILHGDITDIDILDEANIDKADSVIGLTGEDAANITACLYAKRAGAGETMAVIHRMSLLSMMEEAGIDATISPRTASADAVLQLVHRGSTSVSTFLDGEIEMVEFPIAEDSPVANQRIMDQHLPKDVLIGAVVDGSDVSIARGQTTIPANGTAIIICTPDRVEEVRQVFTNRD